MIKMLALAAAIMTAGCITIEDKRDKLTEPAKLSCPAPVVNVSSIPLKKTSEAYKPKAKYKVTKKVVVKEKQDEPKKCIEWQVVTKEEPVCTIWTE
jgi:hypothetical protein